MKYKFADLFCGCGGLSLGLIQAGFKDSVASDFWEIAEKNYTSYPLLSNTNFMRLDMFNIDDRAALVKKLQDEKVDILAGGPPCQGFSTLGKREAKDHRNALVEAYLNVAKDVFPKVIIMENVPAIQSMKHESGDKYPEYAKRFLQDLGYYAETTFIDGSQVGLAQTRKRLFLLAFRRDILQNIKNFKDVFSDAIEKLVPEKKHKTVREVIGDLPSLESGEGGDVLLSPNGTIFNHYVFPYESKTLARIQAVPPNGGLQDIPDYLLSDHLKKMKSGGYGTGGFVKNLYGRLDWEKPSGTIVAGIKKITCGRYIHPHDNRLLTVREAARLQGFPDDYRFVGSLVDQYTVVGNAVPPKFGLLIGQVVTTILDKYHR